MPLLLTGASGFLGRNIIGRLGQCYSVTTLGRSATSDIVADLAAGVPTLTGQFDVVVHAAGKAHELPGKENDDDFRRVNIGGTANLCRALEETGLPKAFVFISSVAVYGEEAGANVAEDHPLDGTSAYARSKIEAEAIVTDWCARYGVPLAILRPALIVGPHATGNMEAMIRGIRRGIYANVGGGKALRSIVAAADMAEVILKAIGRNDIYNICEQRHRTVAEIARRIADLTGRRHLPSLPLWLARAAALPGDLLNTLPNRHPNALHSHQTNTHPTRHANSHLRRWPLDSYRLRKLTESLTFDSAKARRDLQWHPLDALATLSLQ